MISKYKLIVGLGNIGSKYNSTRHNLGFIFLDYIKEHLNFSEFSNNKKNNFSLSQSSKLSLMKPATYMNASGLAVLSYISKNSCKPNEILVIHDDLNLPNEQIKLKEGGGSGGHNGLKSISNSIGADYHRIRLGIGHPGDGVANFVLEKTDLSNWHSIIENWTTQNAFWE